MSVDEKLEKVLAKYRKKIKEQWNEEEDEDWGGLPSSSRFAAEEKAIKQIKALVVSELEKQKIECQGCGSNYTVEEMEEVIKKTGCLDCCPDGSHAERVVNSKIEEFKNKFI